MPASRRVTALDVAREAGVSRATVSYVLNGSTSQRVSEATRARVTEVAKRLGYVPNAAALSLRAGSNRLVLVAIPYWPLGPRVAELVSGLVEGLRRLGYQPLVLFHAATDARAFQAAWSSVQPIGIIAPAGLLDEPLCRALRAGGTRGILAIGDAPRPEVPTLVIAQAPVGALAARHLVATGHRHLLMIHPDTPDAAPIVEGRLPGIRAVLDDAGGTLRVAPLAVGSEALEAQFRALLAEDPRPTGVVAFSDETAALALGVLRAIGVAVPGEMAVIGVDDSETALASDPPLTSIHIPVEREQLVAALAAMDAAARGDAEAEAVAIATPAPRLIARRST